MPKHHRYIKTGVCIWWGKKEPDVSFYTKPHIVPQSLGGDEIGVDVCDGCNRYFGTATKDNRPNPDFIIKEIFKAYEQFTRDPDEHTWEKLNSKMFEYRHSKGVIRIKHQYCTLPMTKQFKRGLYEMFLQKYHSVTGNANHPMFNLVRHYARYGVGNLRVFYTFRHIILWPEEKYLFKMLMTEHTISEMFHTGLFRMDLCGQVFYLEIFPTVFEVHGYQYLQNEAQNSLLVRPDEGDCIKEVRSIDDIDYFMQRFHANPNNK